VDDAAVWLVWSDEHGGWWRPNRQGYTRKIAEAGRYSESAVDTICREANYGPFFNECKVLAPEALLAPTPKIVRAIQEAEERRNAGD
jgi:hypothetical protein